MQRLWLFAGSAVLCGTAFAAATTPQGNATHIARAVATCTANGAFDFRFGREYDAEAELAELRERYAPFKGVSLSQNEDGVYNIDAVAELSGGSIDENAAAALHLYRAIEERIRQTRRFAERKELVPVIKGVTGAVRHRSDSNPKIGYTLVVSFGGPFVWISCVDNARKRANFGTVPYIDLDNQD